MSETLDRILEYARQNSARAAGGGDALAAMRVDKVFDSIAMIGFLTFLEQAFQVRISDADVLPHNFESFHAVARLIESKRGGRGD